MHFVRPTSSRGILIAPSLVQQQQQQQQQQNFRLSLFMQMHSADEY